MKKIEILQDIIPETELEQIEIDKEICNLSRQIINVTKTHITEVKTLLDLLGVKYYDAPGEAEKYIVFLQQHNIIDYIVTDDTDIFTFGGINVLKSTIKNDIIETKIEMLLEKMNYTKEKFVEFCILSGCDYLPYVPNIAINTVYTLFKKHNTINDIITLNKYNFPSEYTVENLESIRDIFLKFEYDIPDVITNNVINKDNLKEFLKNMNIVNYNKIIDKF